MRKHSFCSGFWICAGMLVLILDSKTALSGARSSVDLILYTVIPSLFPFFFLSILLTSSYKEATPLFRIIGKLFHMPEGTETVALSAFLGGYPAGAQAVGNLFQHSRITKDSAHRMLMYCSNAGPSFLFGIIASSFPESRTVWLLWLIHLSGALWISGLLPPDTAAVSVPCSKSNLNISEVLTATIRVTAAVSGWVILFRILIAFLERWILWLFPPDVQVLLSGILELTNGCCRLSQIADVRLRFLICSAMLSAGGFCVALQTKAVIGDLSLGPYLRGKALQTLFSLCASIAFAYHNMLPLVVVLCVTVFLRRKKQNSSGNPVILGV